MKPGIATLADCPQFDEIIDVRSPAEFTEDHLPGAINCPVLDDEQRARIGTLYKQVSPFAAKRLGAAWVARAIAEHIETRFIDQPRTWRPLIYCWRGGQRSGSMTTIFRQIGWAAAQLEGGYKTYRQQVVAELATLPRQFCFRVICGATGSGKTRILQALAQQGAQIIDLEQLAAHKGSVLGVLPETRQPAQKMFESRLLQELRNLDPGQPVYIEAESRKIGRLQVPETLIESMRAGQCVNIDASLATRVEFLLDDYDYFLQAPEWLNQRLAALKDLRGNETIARWQQLANTGTWSQLVHELLEQHYDPLYLRSQQRNYSGYGEPLTVHASSLRATGVAAVATATRQAFECLSAPHPRPAESQPS